ncbi:hypothetical protein E2C01_017747 [Portunus trituberculatus]|uniref:Uncharacterized protein n=1 Tax=Portunus trituberculatus TaxID=210409 RepID=A0A5B7DUD7_PORTR|nr:hypothetical protein [Portunus trituberculatus]
MVETGVMSQKRAIGPLLPLPPGGRAAPPEPHRKLAGDCALRIPLESLSGSSKLGDLLGKRGF